MICKRCLSTPETRHALLNTVFKGQQQMLEEESGGRVQDVPHLTEGEENSLCKQML